tara:strand:- start:29916 stop:30368 length:453 start_codon:yes stop_codon:yes gene_type:complete
MARGSARWAIKGLPYKFRSKFECSIADQLIDSGLKWEYETVTLPYTSNVRGVCNDCGSSNVHKRRSYTPDFRVILPSGQDYFIEVKGRFTSPDRTKMKDVRKCYPDLDIRMLFQSNNSTGETRHKTYGGWCDNIGYEWWVVDIPEDWFES